MIASEEPCVRAPVVSPGALNRSASMRMQRCSISADWGYSAWSMKFTRSDFIDHLVGLGLHPRRHERREVAGRQAVEHHLLLEQAQRFLGCHAAFGSLSLGAGSSR